jgi:hypothetical protein
MYNRYLYWINELIKLDNNHKIEQYDLFSVKLELKMTRIF